MIYKIFRPIQLTIVIIFNVFLSFFAKGQTPSPLHLAQISHLPLSMHAENNGAAGGFFANDVTGFIKDGIEYAVVGFFKGTSIISLANPASDYIKIETTNIDNGVFSLYNAQGSLVKTVNTNNTTTVSLTELVSGAYFYEYSVEDAVVERNKLQIIK